MVHIRSNAVCLFVALFLCAGGAARALAEVTPTDLRSLHEKLSTPVVEDTHVLAAAGQVLESEDLAVTFHRGQFFRLVRSDGRDAGLVFVGDAGADSATARFEPQDAHEQGQLARFLGAAPYETGVHAAWIRATDDSVEALLDDAGWTDGEGADAASRARTIHDARLSQYRDPLWNETGPALEMDALEDLHGSGFAGGHLFAELKVSPTDWVTYYRNLRGGLFAGEGVCLFRHKPHGKAPREIDVYASYPSAAAPDPGAADRPYDLVRADLDVTIPRAGGEQNLSRVEIIASLQVQALADGLRGLTLALQSRRPRELGDEDWAVTRVSSVRDSEGRELPAVHDRNRLFVRLDEPLGSGEVVTLDVTYAGDLIEPVGSGDLANLYYTILRRHPWYPINPSPDLHAVGVTVRTPRFLRGVAPGDLVSDVDDKEAKQRTCTYEERRGIRLASLAVGDYVITEYDDGPVPIRVYTTQMSKQAALDTAKQVHVLLEFFGALWGPYPYGTINVVDYYPYGDELLRDTEAGWLTAYDRGRRRDGAMLFVSMVLGGTSIRTVAASLSQQWWGQRVAPASYREWWITDGLASFGEALAMRRFDSPGTYERILRDWHQSAGFAELHGNLLTGHRVGRHYSPVNRARAVAVMQMLMAQMGTEPFLETMRRVIQRAPNEGLSCAGFRTQLERTMGAEAAEAFWTYWIEWNEIPGLEYEYSIAADDGAYRVEGTLRFDVPPPPGPIPVAIHYAGKEVEITGVVATGSETPFVIDGLRRKPKKVEVDPDHVMLLAHRRGSKAK